MKRWLVTVGYAPSNMTDEFAMQSISVETIEGETIPDLFTIKDSRFNVKHRGLFFPDALVNFWEVK